MAWHGMALIQLQPHVNCHRKFHRVLHLYMVFFSTLKIHATRAQFWILSATGWCWALVVISICFFFFFFFIIIWPRKRKISIFGHQSLHSFSDWVSHARRRRIVTITVVVVIVVNVTTIAAATAITHFTCVFAFVFVQRGIDRWKVGKKDERKQIRRNSCVRSMYGMPNYPKWMLYRCLWNQMYRVFGCTRARTHLGARNTSNTLTNSIMCSSSILGLGVCARTPEREWKRWFHLLFSFSPF